MWVHRCLELLNGRLEVTSHHELGNQLGGVRPDDVGSQDLRILLVSDDLYEALRVPPRYRTPVAGPWEFSHSDIVPLSLGLLLREPH